MYVIDYVGNDIYIYCIIVVLCLRGPQRTQLGCYMCMRLIAERGKICKLYLTLGTRQ